jgi:hypothetical protein
VDVVVPAGYSGSCLMVGALPGWCPAGKYLYLNCATAPTSGLCFPVSEYGLHAATVGAFCC